MSPQADTVIARLERARVSWWRCSLVSGLVLAGAFVLAVFAAFALVDALLGLPQSGLLALFVGWSLLTVGAVVALLLRLRRCRRSLSATARRVEIEMPELESHLINLVQFASSAFHRNRNGETGDPFRRAALNEAAAAMTDVAFEEAAARSSRRRRFMLAMLTPRDTIEAWAVLAAIVGLTVGLGAAVPTWPSAIRRLARPWEFIPTVGSVKIINVAPGDTEVLMGSGLEVTALVATPARKNDTATLFVRPKGTSGPETAVQMLPDASKQTFVAALPQILHPVEYRLRVGDSQTKRYTVGVYERPTVSAVQVTYEFPAYLGRPPETRSQTHADLEAPQYTRASLRITPSTPVASGRLVIDGQTIAARVNDGGRELLADLLLKESTTYAVHLVTQSGHTDPGPRINRVMVVPDAPPTVQLAEPAAEASAATGAKVAVVVRAGDDYGLSEARIEIKPGDDESADNERPRGDGTASASAAPETLARWTTFADPGSATLFRELVLDPAKFKPGQSALVRAVVRDGRALELLGQKLGPQEASTPWHRVRVMAMATKASADLARLDALRAELLRLLQEQVLARARAAEVPKLATREDTTRIADEVLRRQVGVQKRAVALVDSRDPGAAEETRTVKRVVNKLAYGDMLAAVHQAEGLAQLQSPAAAATPATTLVVTQDRVIDVLRRLLGELRNETARQLADLKERSSTELPQDVKDKLRDLKSKLAEFLKQQKKVIEATENLAKTPVDDFTEKDQQLRKDLAAAEDDWSRFMADRHTDLSKLPEQDFSNPSALKELLEVETELKMARDVLTKKSAEIAVPLEQLAAEMAKEISTNIEKWLPDTPDRERWSQEEPLTDAMKEAPMAELPKELEDIVGKLMEGEEDLFDEMEDVSSSWTDSLDKGAGWDAMDGPISNMSARGVTGNRLPNTSEISGRSGEGRSGKSTGEFAADTASGKGGRKTPSRLTPDAFTKGQVKDLSKEPVGGATGGGKESGQGGEGLRGPLPNRPERQLARLAARQASLRNKAEAVDLKFQVMKFHHTDLKRLIAQMAAVEDDLKAGRYRNALRRREVLLEELGKARMAVQGESVIRRDETANLPTGIQKQILGSMSEASPEGWDELNRRYFERLSTAKPAAPARAPSPGVPARRP